MDAGWGGRIERFLGSGEWWMIMDDGVCSMLMLNADWCFWYYGPCSGVAQRHCKVSWPQKRRSFRYESVWGWWCRYIYDDLWCMIYQGGSSWKKLFSISDVKKIPAALGPQSHRALRFTNHLDSCCFYKIVLHCRTRVKCMEGWHRCDLAGKTKKRKLHRCISIYRNYQNHTWRIFIRVWWLGSSRHRFSPFVVEWKAFGLCSCQWCLCRGTGHGHHHENHR